MKNRHVAEWQDFTVVSHTSRGTPGGRWLEPATAGSDTRAWTNYFLEEAISHVDAVVPPKPTRSACGLRKTQTEPLSTSWGEKKHFSHCSWRQARCSTSEPKAALKILPCLKAREAKKKLRDRIFWQESATKHVFAFAHGNLHLLQDQQGEAGALLEEPPAQEGTAAQRSRRATPKPTGLRWLNKAGVSPATQRSRAVNLKDNKQ